MLRKSPFWALALGAAACLSIFALGLRPAFALFDNARWTTLDNGLQIVVIENRRAPVIHAKLAYDVGSDDERPDQAGLAHFLEHMMFRGSDTLGPGDYDLAMGQIGADFNASTSADLTTYFATFGSQHLDAWMALEADRMRGILLADSEVESERGVVLTEKLQQHDANPQVLWGTEITRRTQGEAAARHPIGETALLETYSPDDLRAFYEDWYVPNNAALIISGDIDFDQAVALATEHFGDFPSKPLPARTEIPGQFTANDPLFEMIDERVSQDKGAIVTWIPSIRRLGMDEQEALRLQYASAVLGELVSGELRAPLDRMLTVEQEIGTSVSFGIYLDDLESGAHTSIEPAPGVDVDDALDALEAAIPLAIDEALEAELVERAKRRFIRSTIYANDSVQGPANAFLGLYARGENWQRNLEIVENINVITLEDLKDVVALYRQSDQRLRATLRKNPRDTALVGE